MPTGVSHIYYPKEQPKPLHELALDDSYFLVKLHDAQAFFKAGLLVDPKVLIFSSSVESSFQSGSAIQSLHQITMLQKNTPCHLGIGTNLTDWLPARSADKVTITLNYHVLQDTVFRDLVDKMEQMDLAAKVSLIQPEWAVAVKVSQIAGRFLSYILEEGKRHEIFALKFDLNLADLQTGFYAVFGSHTDESWPRELRMDKNKRVTDENGRALSNLSYAVIEARALPRRGEEIARDEAWWELLQTGKQQILDGYFTSEQEREKAYEDWRKTLTQVRALTNKAHGFLAREINQIIHDAQMKVEQKLLPQTEAEAFGPEELTQAWQEVLGVSTEQELQQSVRDYQDALAASEQLIKKYTM